MNEREKNFRRLCKDLKNILDELFEKYPNACIPLTVTPTKSIDLLDYIVPNDFVDKCIIDRENLTEFSKTY